MRSFALALSSIVLALAAPGASAEPNPFPDAQPPPAAKPIRGVVELFTSQGCSSCPPADLLMRTFTESDDVVVLSYHVDYWDYIGWRDTLASPRNTERQRFYASRLNTGPVYTPQVVVNGQADALGSDRGAIGRALEATAPAFAARRVPLHFWHHGNSIIIEAAGAPEGTEPKEATIWLAVVQKQANVDVTRGENAGRQLVYTNVVRELTPVGLWNGRPASIRLARGAVMTPESEKLIVLMQETETGLITGAARLGELP